MTRRQNDDTVSLLSLELQDNARKYTAVATTMDKARVFPRTLRSLQRRRAVSRRAGNHGSWLRTSRHNLQHLPVKRDDVSALKTVLRGHAAQAWPPPDNVLMQDRGGQ
ncbi:hypothetical protein V5799_014965 [Amblyomma americanum]|uniref:Uncharacterized protein n=1 Tax=Amblyomma americanum TaxID=6943 RepID=A0AAQ4E1I0_AMBAM